eukprot:TRINITY_DN4601_c0_g1_i3.p1 TRINITY_DN4601_c0_g1~~TRINITY_DN4601_c0_g1_i3.p1  ORF type:complete len:145 (-),score=34.82 TRINITY_DN4601_c0_g1_i3:28-462(-)
MPSPGVDSLALLPALLCLACGLVGANLNDDLKGIGGMECRNGKWFLNGEEVTGVSNLFGQKLAKNKNGLKCVEDNGQDYKEDDGMKEETYKGGELSNQVKKITPIQSMTELKGIQEIEKMTPVNWIEEIKSMREVKSIEEIKEK